MKRKFLLGLVFLLTLIGVVGCGAKLNVSFKDDMPEEITVDSLFDVGTYLVKEEGVDYEVSATYQANGETKSYEVVDFVFTPTELGELTVKVIARKDKAEAEGTAKITVIDKLPVISSIPEGLAYRLNENIDLAEIEIVVTSKSQYNLVWKSVKTPSGDVELDDESYEFEEGGTYEFNFEVTNEAGTVSGKLTVTATESNLTVSVKEEELNFDRKIEDYDLLENLEINLTENVEVEFKVSGERYDGASGEPIALENSELADGKLSLKDHGSYTVAYKVTDTQYDFSLSGSFEVNVSDKSVPVISEIDEQETYEGYFNFDELLEIIEVNDEYHRGLVFEMSVKDSDGNDVELEGNVALLLPGTYVVTIKVEDGFGNADSIEVAYNVLGPDEGDFFVRSRIAQAEFFQGKISKYVDIGVINYTTVTAKLESANALKINYNEHLGWPGVLIDLNGTHDFTDGTLEFYVSFHHMHSWLGILLFDAEGNNFMVAEKGIDMPTGDGYHKIKVLLEEFRNFGNENFDLSKVGKIGLVFNTHDYEGSTNPHEDKYVLLDNLTVKFYETLDEDLIHIPMDVSQSAQDPNLEFEFVEDVVATPESKQALKAYIAEGIKRELWFHPTVSTILTKGTLSAYFKFEGEVVPEVKVRVFRPDWSGSSRIPFTLELQENGWYYGTIDTSLLESDEIIRFTIEFNISDLVVYIDQMRFIPAKPDTSEYSLNTKTGVITLEPGIELSATEDFKRLITSGNVLDPDTTYYLRRNGGIAFSETLVITTPPVHPTPQAPVPESKTFDTVTLVFQEGHEYSMDGVNWQDSNVFTDLIPETEYKFYQRVKASESGFVSEPSEALTVTTDEAPIGKPTYLEFTIDYANETLQYDGDAIEVNTAADFTGTAVESGSQIEPGITLYARYTGVTEIDEEYVFVLKIKDRPAISEPNVETTFDSIIVTTATACVKYRVNGGDLQESNTFTELESDTVYEIAIVLEATENAFRNELVIQVRTEKKYFEVNANDNRTWEGANFFVVENWNNSDKIFSFEFKPSSASGFVQFSVMTKDWKRISEYIQIHFDRMSANFGVVTELGEGWYRYEVPLRALPVNVAEGATADMELAMLYWGQVPTSFLVANVKMEIGDAVHGAFEIRTGGLDILEAKEGYYEATSNWAFSGKTLSFDFKVRGIVNPDEPIVRFSLLNGWNRASDFIIINCAEFTSNVGTVTELGNGWYHFEVALSEVPINTEEGATGEEVLNLICWSPVNAALLVDNFQIA